MKEEKEEENNSFRPLGKIKMMDDRGYAYLPKMVRKELGMIGKDEIPFVVDANCVLLVRKNANLKEVLEGLDILRRDIELRGHKKEEKEE